MIKDRQENLSWSECSQVDEYPLWSVWTQGSERATVIGHTPSGKPIVMLDKLKRSANEPVRAVSYHDTTGISQPSNTFSSLDSKEGLHYVYCAKHFDTIYYIGMGYGDRYKHVLSGQSHNKYLNSHTYVKGLPKLTVEILATGLSKSFARSLEKRLITRIKPIYNRTT